MPNVKCQWEVNKALKRTTSTFSVGQPSHMRWRILAVKAYLHCELDSFCLMRNNCLAGFIKAHHLEEFFSQEKIRVHKLENVIMKIYNLYAYLRLSKP